MRARVESTVSVLGTLGLAAGFLIGGVLGEASLLGTRLTLFGGAVSTAAAALLLAGREVRKVHTAADVPVASGATGVMS